MSANIVLYGCGVRGGQALSYFGSEHIYAFCDGNNALVNTEKHGKRVIDKKLLLKLQTSFVVVITPSPDVSCDIALELDDMGIKDYFFLDELRENKITASDLNNYIGLKNTKGFSRWRDFYEKKNTYYKKQIHFLRDHVDAAKLLPNSGYIRKKQIELLNFAEEFFEFIREINIKPILIDGNLLGFYRNKSYIPWDDDLDFALIRSDYEKLLLFCEENIYAACYDEAREFSEGEAFIPDDILRRNPNKYILVKRHDHLQIMRGTSYEDRQVIDFFALDFFSEGAKIEDLKTYLKNVKKEYSKLDDEKKKFEYSRKKWSSQPYLVDDGPNMFFGMDNMSALHDIENAFFWRKSVIFPLKGGLFENHVFYVPKNPYEYLIHVYKEVGRLPSDVGISIHNEEEIKRKHKYLLNVELYLSNISEIQEWMELYKDLRQRGVYCIYILQERFNGLHGDMLKEAAKILNEHEIEYYDEPYSSVQIVIAAKAALVERQYNTNSMIIEYGSLAHNRKEEINFKWRQTYRLDDMNLLCEDLERYFGR